jgi:hypothetical protein
MKAWARGEDVEGARKGQGRNGLAAQWWATQAAVVGFASIYLALTGSPWWLLFGVPVAAWQARRAFFASRKQETWERLYGDGTTRRY